MATAEAASSHDGHEGHDEHHGHLHGPFIAHHFTGPRQQYDAAKLGIWLFLVTEVLFFSGLFVAYAVYRYHHPEVFMKASEFLDTTLGAINTLVLLLSSLTMAWAVRAAQLEQRKVTTLCTLITILCATIFLGVKAVEYSHKWDMGIFVDHFFNYQPGEHHDSKYLTMLSIGPGICVAICAALAALTFATGKPLAGKFWGAMTLGLAGYFVGVAGGLAYQGAVEKGDHGAAHGDAAHAEEAHDEASHAAAGSESSVSEGTSGEGAADVAPAEGAPADAMVATVAADHSTEDLPRNLGLFFSIYYFMTGLHAVHIIAGIMALAWILYRSIHGHFRADYFGPVDYVGLYWHLVDLIWIYLFPLLYLIG